MNRRGVIASVAAGLVLGFGQRAAHAGLVTWDFGGEITFVLDPDNDLGGAITMGTPFSGSFTFELDTPDSTPESVELGTYIDAITEVSGKIGVIAFAGPKNLESRIRITDSAGDNDIFGLGVQDILFPTLGISSSLGLSLSESTGLALLSNELSENPPELGLFPGSTVSFNFNQSNAFVSGELSILVPEPTSLGLIAFGAIAVFWKRRSFLSLRACGLVFVIGIGFSLQLHAQEWNPDWGPVIIGGGDFDEHRTEGSELTGDAFIREGFKFLAANVKTQNRIAVCVGCQHDGQTAFQDAAEGLDL